MRQIPLPITARLGFGVVAAVLLASAMPASQAAAARPAAGPRVPPRAGIMTAAGARAWARPGASARERTGIISGVVHGVTGSPVAGACVAAQGRGSRAVTRSGPDGRYLLGGLRPGRYQIHVGSCAAARPGQAVLSAAWSAERAVVTVRAGQISSPAPITLWQFSDRWLTAPKGQAPLAGARTGSISGLVTGNGRPLRGVCAVAYPLSRPESFRYAVTNKAGKFRVSRLRPGRYEVLFVAGLRPCPNDGNWLPQWYPQVNSPFPTGKVKLVRVAAGKDTAHINGRLKLGGEIAGTVRAKSGKALPGICVNVFANFQGGSIGIEYLLTTDKAGRYAAHGLFPAGYQVQFSIGCGNKGNYAGQWWHGAAVQSRASTIRITGTRQVTDINATLLPGATVSGVVKAVTVTGKPLAGVCVDAVDTDGNPDAFAVTARDGRYHVSGLAAGRYVIQFDPTCGGNNSKYLFVQRAVTLAIGQTVPGFNAYLPIGGGISGLVTDMNGRPAGGVCVQVLDDNGDTTLTKPDGHYTIAGVPTGSDPVQFFGGCGNPGSLAPQFYHNSPGSVFATPIRFRPNTITPNIDVRMEPGGTLAGLVTDTEGHRLSNVCVTAVSAVPVGLLNYAAIEPTTGANAEDGRYLIPNLAPDPYYITFACGGYGQQLFPSRPSLAGAELIAANPGVTTRVPPTRLSRAGAISGKVTSKAGKPLGLICVAVAPPGTMSAFLFAGFAITTGNGRYRIGGLQPGRYQIQFSDCSGSGRAETQWYRGQFTRAAATVVSVYPGRTDAGINAVLRRGGTVTGRVLGPSGRPANAICVTAFNAAAQSSEQSQTGRSGTYRVTGLSPGRWSLSFAPCFSPKPDLGSVIRPGTVRVTEARTVTGVDVHLPRGGSVSGRVVAGPDAAPIGGVCVLLLPVNPKDNPGSGGATGGNGDYTAAHLAPGKYRAYIADPGCDFLSDVVTPLAPQWYRGQPTSATATIVRVRAGGALTGIDSALRPFGSVTGTVQTAARAAVPGECVTAVPYRAPLDPTFGTPAPAEVAITGRTGRYTLTALAPGRYRVKFSGGCGATGFATQWWDNAGSAKAAKVITVGFATISGVDATLRR